MPIKHQAQSYRNRNGIRFENDGDVFGLTVEEIRTNAKDAVAELRKVGRKAFYEIQDGGAYARIFAAAAPTTINS
jgi:hypothetical protein